MNGNCLKFYQCMYACVDVFCIYMCVCVYKHMFMHISETKYECFLNTVTFWFKKENKLHWTFQRLRLKLLRNLNLHFSTFYLWIWLKTFTCILDNFKYVKEKLKLAMAVKIFHSKFNF